MSKFLKIVLVLAIGAGTFFLLPEKKFKLPAKEIAKETGVNPVLANFVVNTKLGRKIGYLIVRKKVKKYIKKEILNDKKANKASSPN